MHPRIVIFQRTPFQMNLYRTKQRLPNEWTNISLTNEPFTCFKLESTNKFSCFNFMTLNSSFSRIEQMNWKIAANMEPAKSSLFHTKYKWHFVVKNSVLYCFINSIILYSLQIIQLNGVSMRFQHYLKSIFMNEFCWFLLFWDCVWWFEFVWLYFSFNANFEIHFF